MTGYYDYVLGLIPAALIGISLSLTLVGLPLTSGVAIGAFVALGLMGHAMFINSPVTDASSVPTEPSSSQPSSTSAPPTQTARSPPTNAD